MGTGLRCVWVIVPIDRADPAAGNMGVSVAIRPGTGGESLAPLAVLQGGPGGASSRLAQVLPSRPYPQVLIDQRGVGFGSFNSWCPELLNALVAMVEATSERADAIGSGAAGHCSDRLRQDPAFAGISTAAHAADVVDVMAALGHERWLLYGVSYGTTIALEVLRDAPEGLAGAVLDGVLPGYLDQDAGVAAGADRVIQKLDEECRVDPACSAILAGAADGEGATMAGLLAELIPRFNSDPIVVSLSGEETTMQEPIDALIDGDSVAGTVLRAALQRVHCDSGPRRAGRTGPTCRYRHGGESRCHHRAPTRGSDRGRVGLRAVPLRRSGDACGCGMRRMGDSGVGASSGCQRVRSGSGGRGSVRAVPAVGNSRVPIVGGAGGERCAGAIDLGIVRSDHPA